MGNTSAQSELRLEGATRAVRWVAHELNNALGTISGCAQLIERLLKQAEISNSQQRALEYAKAIYEEATRCSKLLQETVLTVQGSEPVFSMVGIHNVLDMAVARALPVSDHGIAVHRTYDAAVPEIEADQPSIEDAFYQIVLNAVQSMPAGGELRIDTSYEPAEDGRGSVHVFVTDTGTGIPEEDIYHVFDPFFTTKGRARGLGLSLAVRAVRRHGGDLRLQSACGRGTTVEVVLPVRGCES
ncbi:MAG: two-component system sensor histidine kinase NtrB [Armatimonadota bacterium]